LDVVASTGASPSFLVGGWPPFFLPSQRSAMIWQSMVSPNILHTYTLV